LPPPPFTLEARPARERLVLAATGSIDLATAPGLVAAIEEARADGWKHVVLDFRDVDFVDSSGLHVLLDLRADPRGVTFELVGDAPPVRELLELVGEAGVLPSPDPAWVEASLDVQPPSPGRPRCRRDVAAMANWALAERRGRRRRDPRPAA
jgi:anti-anti-sigma factor